MSELYSTEYISQREVAKKEIAKIDLRINRSVEFVARMWSLHVAVLQTTSRK